MSAFQEFFIRFLQQNMVVSVVILTVLAVRLLLGKLPKKYSYFLWSIVGLRMLFDLDIQSKFSLFNLCRISVTPSANDGIAANIAPSNKTGAPPVLGGVSKAGTNSVGITDAGSSANFTLIILALIWITGMIGLLAYHTVSYIHLRKQVQNRVLLRGNIYECNGITTPFILGIFSPKIYIPFHLEEEEQRYILAHEAYHLRRKDQFFKLLAFILLIIYWISPLVWAAYFCFVRDQEISCDEAVLMTFGNDIKQTYSTSLLSFATGKRQHMFAPLAFGESDAAKRIKHVLNFKKPATWAAVIAVLAITVIAVTCLTSRQEKTTDTQSETAAESSETRQSEPTDSILTETYDITQSISFDEIKSTELGGTITLGNYTADLFDGFSGSPLICDQYEEPQHGDGAPAAWYSLGGIGEWKEPEEWAFTYNGQELSSAALWGNHTDREMITSFRSDSFYGLLYRNDYDLYTAAELGENPDPNLQTTSQYWVAYLSEGSGEPVYVLYLNCDYFTEEEILQWVESVRKMD